MSHQLNLTVYEQLRHYDTNSDIADSKNTEHIVTGRVTHIDQLVLKM
jgi:hypothetical protein